MTRQPLPARQNRLLRHYLAEAVSHARSPYTREPMKNITVEYRHNFPLDPVDVVRVFDHSGIKRPTGELTRIARMFAAPCLLLSAWGMASLWDWPGR